MAHFLMWSDFPPEQLPRARGAVPVSRANGMAMIYTPTGMQEVSEKTLRAPFLSLLDRVLYRKRVELCVDPLKSEAVLHFPMWDFNGPDLHYFSTWNTGEKKFHAFRVGPWDVDGRQLVADAKDRVLQMIEAAEYTKTHSGKAVRLVIHNDASNITLQRGWSMGNRPWLAFFSGVRKACEARPFPILVVSPTNPYDGMTRANPVAWFTEAPEFDGISIHCYPIDPFAMYSSEVYKRMQDALGDASINCQTFQSTLPVQFRSPMWNPMTKLGVFK